MTRPKVDPDKRQRTAQACESCKRRKQKCNGQQPCQTCTKRNLSCVYGSAEDGPDRDELISPKRRMVDSPSNASSTGSLNHSSPFGSFHPSPKVPQWTSVANSRRLSTSRVQDGDSKSISQPLGIFSAGQRENPKAPASVPDVDSNLLVSAAGSVSDERDEEALVYNYTYTRMLQDPSGRLLYIGDSATLSFLQLLRMVVDSVSGPSPFTLDPRRHRIVENTITLPDNIRHTHLLPDRQTANVLVDSYFTNTNGLIDIFFQRKLFMTALDTCYADPLSTDPNFLCHLFLVMAIGLVMAAPIPGTPEDGVIQKLRGEAADRAEVFYLDAKSLKDPTAGFADSGFWSIQALALMAVYNLAVSKRNAAYAYFGMAVRSAFALGLHREETMCIFGAADQSIRRSLWRSLFVLDRFLAASLGRPTAIRESDCSGTTLSNGDSSPFFPQASRSTGVGAVFARPNTIGLEAAVRSCHAIGMILEKVYSQRKISIKIAQEIADECKSWNTALDPSLHYSHASLGNPAQGIAILHVNLLYCHSIVLLTRPFFLYVMNRVHQDPTKFGNRSERHGMKMDKFGDACVTSSTHSIALVQTALENRFLPYRNPFVLYFVFAAGLIVLANEFSGIYHNAGAKTAIANCINIMNYFAQQDPQGSRLLFILSSFRDVVQREQASRDQQTLGEIQAKSQALTQTQTIPVNHTNDPMSTLFQGSTKLEPSASSATSSTRNNSTASLGSQPTNITFHTSIPGSSSASHETVSPTGNGPGTMIARHNSLDAFFNLASSVNRYPDSTGGSSSVHESDSFNDTEIDFESLWQWPSSTGLTPGLGPGMPLTSVMDTQSLHASVQGISDSAVPLFGMNSAEFGVH